MASTTAVRAHKNTEPAKTWLFLSSIFELFSYIILLPHRTQSHNIFDIFMSEPEKPELNWDIPLNFDRLETRQEEALPPPKIPPRQVLAEKFPKILARIELLWCSPELHNYLEQTLFTDRSKREGFPKDVLQALGEIHIEHTRLLKEKKLLGDDIWDV